MKTKEELKKYEKLLIKIRDLKKRITKNSCEIYENQI